MNNQSGPSQSFENTCKDTELLAVYEYLQKNTATASMVAVHLNIWRPNVCRHKRTLEKTGRLKELGKAICPITKHKATMLTTNPQFIIKQLPYNERN